MAFDRRTFSLTVPNPAATVAVTANLAADFVRILGHKVLLTGTDTAVRLRLTDADSRVFYLDAADKDYKTAAITTPIILDDTTTGLGPAAFDAVGVAASAGQGGSLPVVKNPLEIAVVNGGTAGDVISVTLDYEYGRFKAVTKTSGVPTAGTATMTMNLPGAKFAQIVGFKALSVGTSTTSRIKIEDADNRVLYLDAADKDYDTAALDKTILWDDTTTGLTGIPRDSTGAAATAASVVTGGGILARSPLTITHSNAEGGDELLTVTVYYRV